MVDIALNTTFYLIACWICIWIGNFATSFYFRIPRDIEINGQKNPPMCSNCKTKLKYPDYGPIYYYLFKGKHCKVCGVEIPKEYFFIELIYGAVLILNIGLNKITEQNITNTLFISTLLLAVLIDIRWKQAYNKQVWLVLTTAMLRLFFLNKTPDGILENLVASFILAFVALKIINILLKEKHDYNSLFLISAASIGFLKIEFVILLGLSVIIYCFCNKIKWKNYDRFFVTKHFTVMSSFCFLSIFEIIFNVL